VLCWKVLAWSYEKSCLNGSFFFASESFESVIVLNLTREEKSEQLQLHDIHIEQLLQDIKFIIVY
jgi:hypothetical protein